MPALYVAGEHDLVVEALRRSVDERERYVPRLREKALLPGCGHRTQQERPAEVNARLLAFLGSLL